MVAFNSSWAPNEDPGAIFSEKCWLQGEIICAVAYGVICCLYFMSLSLLLPPKNRHTSMTLKQRLSLLIYITLSFIFGTMYMVQNTIWTQMAFIDYRDYPGGPSAFENDMSSTPFNNWGNALFGLSNWVCDILVVWRFKVIYQSSRIPIWVSMMFPCLIFAASIATGIMFMYQLMTTDLPYVEHGVNYVLPFLSISVALNILLTVAIVSRILGFKRRNVSALGPQFGKQYTSLAAMIIESAALYSVFSVVFLVLHGVNSPVSEAFDQFLSQIQIIATLLIVFRVAEGKAWSNEVVTRTVQNRRLDDVEVGTILFANSSPTALSEPTSSGETSTTPYKEGSETTRVD